MERRKWIAVLLALAGLLLLQAACAESGTDLGMYDPYSQGGISVSSKELNVSVNTKLPVYGAPYEDAWRGAKGKASVSAKEKFTLLGTVDDGAWCLVEYKIDSASRRMGWIRLPEGARRPSDYGDMTLARRLMRVTRSVMMTDDPKNGRLKIRKIQAGEEVIGLFTCGTNGMVCVETQADGKTVWGLIPADAVEDLSDSLLILEGDTCIIKEGVTAIGDLSDYVACTDRNEAGYTVYRTVTRVRPKDISIRMIDLYSLSESGIRHLKLPESLRWIGPEGISMGSLEELRLGGGMSVSSDAFYGARIGRMILDRDYSGSIPDGQYMTIREWKVEEGNPVYRDRDGVLFSADGKTLLRYPNSRSDEHYDVPAGTEEIGAHAFSDDAMTIPLKSISLPVGLKKIGEYAFADCGYLLSLTVPLTVTELAPNAFCHCVSLERLSLPNGLTAKLDDWVRQEDFSSGFRGDNWATYAQPREKEEWEESGDYFRSYPAVLDNAEGSGTVPVYGSAGDSAPSGEEPVGSKDYVVAVRNGRAALGDDRWVDLKNLRNDTEDVFFRITNGEPADPARRTGTDGKPLQFSNVSWNGTVNFYTVSNYIFNDVYIPLRETILYRNRTGSGEQMGILAPEGDSAALLDSPGGAKVNHLYAGTQAKVLEEADGWVKIETVYGTGWTDRNELMIVPEEP